MHFGCIRPSWEPLAPEVLTRIHLSTYVDSIRNLAEGGGGILDHDTVLSTRSFDVARTAAGAVCDAVDKVITGGERHAFCLIRPPGHHASQNKGMGFCLFNNVALGARRAIDQHGLDRVLIVDWDVHHGNGTQEIFWEDGRVGFFSIHRYPFYPGTGAADEIGAGAGLGTKLNVPITFGTPRTEYLQQFNTRTGVAGEQDSTAVDYYLGGIRCSPARSRRIARIGKRRLRLDDSVSPGGRQCVL